MILKRRRETTKLLQLCVFIETLKRTGLDIVWKPYLPKFIVTCIYNVVSFLQIYALFLKTPDILVSNVLSEK